MNQESHNGHQPTITIDHLNPATNLLHRWRGFNKDPGNKEEPVFFAGAQVRRIGPDEPSVYPLFLPPDSHF